MRSTAAASFAFMLLASASANAQTFSSGSTGADGALDLSTMSCTECQVQLPPNGVLNYTTVNVPVGKTLIFKPNLRNTPVVLLAQGAVNVAGNIDVSQTAACVASGAGACGTFNSPHRIPGPGGFYGGAMDQPGFGPGGGGPGALGHWIGPLSLVPIVGGSGAGGGVTQPAGGCHGEGGGGGGAVVLASSTQIAVTGSINATGGGTEYYPGSCLFVKRGGSGGAIRLVANSIVAGGNLTAVGGGGSYYGNQGGSGVIRIEAPAGALSFTGSATPAAVLSTINPAIVSSAPASLSILSVGGYAIPTYSGQRFDTVDVLLPAQLPDPISVVVAASNIPVGTAVGLNFGTTNSGTVTPGTLVGTAQSSTATVQVSGLNRSQLAYLFVSATTTVPQSAALLNPPGAEHVDQVRIAAAPGAAPTFAFLRADGSVIDKNLLPAEFLKHFQP